MIIVLLGSIENTQVRNIYNMYFNGIICMIEVWWTHPVWQEAAHELCGLNRFSTSRQWSYAHFLVFGFTEQLLYMCVLYRIDTAKKPLLSPLTPNLYGFFFQHLLWILIRTVLIMILAKDKEQRYTKTSNLISTTQLENKTWQYPSKIKHYDFGLGHTSSSKKKLILCSIENYFQNIQNIWFRIHTPPPPSIYSSTPLYFNISLPSVGVIPWGTMGCCGTQCMTRGLGDDGGSFSISFDKKWTIRERGDRN